MLKLWPTKKNWLWVREYRYAIMALCGDFFVKCIFPYWRLLGIGFKIYLRSIDSKRGVRKRRECGQNAEEVRRISGSGRRGLGTTYTAAFLSKLATRSPSRD